MATWLHGYMATSSTDQTCWSLEIRHKSIPSIPIIEQAMRSSSQTSPCPIKLIKRYQILNHSLMETIISEISSLRKGPTTGISRTRLPGPDFPTLYKQNHDVKVPIKLE